MKKTKKLGELAAYLASPCSGSLDTPISGIQYDSRKVCPGDLFVCIQGVNTDGHLYIPQAAKAGAAALLVSREPEDDFGLPVLRCEDSRRALALLSALWYDFPGRRLRTIGVTGTNGKTTTTHLIKLLLEKAGHKTGLIGTIHNLAGEVLLPASYTTPEPLELTALAAMIAEAGCEYLVTEVSSHALHQHRTDGLSFDGAVFTNLTQDHLDYHQTMEAYCESKTLLFRALHADGKGNKYGVVNVDDPWAPKFLAATDQPVWTYAIDAEAMLRAENCQVTEHGTMFDLCYQGERHPVEIPLSGRFNIYNTLAAICVALAEGLALSDVLATLANLPQVAGRFELINEGQPFAVIVDYAHTPDGLENVLSTARLITKRRLLVVFGCGGDRDRSKRPKMGAIAGRLADFAILTSDNPRTEDPMRIIR